ncbi:ATP-binding protein [Candidatus Poriferisodalis sp.]|uniref:ATP-binding protein n=1 Tax=Candidatus Poriferisodalis sp. TaxID=3101277 RepID=UPI003B022E23
MNEPEQEPLRLRFLGSLVEQLGAQLYPGVTATIAELISNAWDADARTVWIDLPLGRSWTERDEITVTDDGDGMSYADAQNYYLRVGRKRRVDLHRDTSNRGRQLHGRKGIGKLAAFGTAKILECHTVDESGQLTSFRLDYDAIRGRDPSADYEVEEAQSEDVLCDGDGNLLMQGTRITLSKLHARRALNEQQFRRSLARRFAIDVDQMRIVLNGEEIGRFDLDVEIRFPAEDTLLPNVDRTADGWGECEIDGKPMRWWIGFTAKPLEEKELQGISVLARGKLVQRPFFFQRTSGTEGQLGQEYLVGEVQADWLDEGSDIDTDLIQANRDQLQLEDERLSSFLVWGQKLVKEALRAWSGIRRQRIYDRLDLRAFEDLLQQLTSEERRRMDRVAKAVTQIPAIELEDARLLVSSLVEAHQDTIVRELLETIDATEPDFQIHVWDLIRQFGLIDARRNQTVVEARLKAITELRKYVDEGATEVPTIHQHIKRHPWLLDPRWYLLDDEVRLSDLGLSDAISEGNRRMDYLFALGPSAPYTHDELLVVEIKRGTLAVGAMYAVEPDEISRFHRYVLMAQRSQYGGERALRVTGLMIAQKYTKDAELQRTSLETTTDVRLVFRTWHQVLQETERLHKGWLAVTKRRAQNDNGADAGSISRHT